MDKLNLALLIHPFKNQLLARESLAKNAACCVRGIADLLAKNAWLRLNVVMPGYVLECLDGLLLSELRDHHKRGAIEFLVTGYTEPFLSISPVWLSRANVRAGVELTTELLGVRPAGYVPPFSNFEPLAIEALREHSIHYVVISSSLLPPGSRERCGYWGTEHLGSWIVLFPSHVMHNYNAPASISSWLANVFAHDQQPSDQVSGTPLAGVHFLAPLSMNAEHDPLDWLRTTVRSLARSHDRYQTVLYGEFVGNNPPLGLQYLQAALDINREGADLHTFRNWLFTYQQLGLLHRRMLEVSEAVEQIAGHRLGARLIKELFAVQDINRFLPAPESGFTQLPDRFWTYGKLIEIEKQLPSSKRLRGGQIRITDQLRNGAKSIVMANRSLKAYVSHRSGGGIYELDFYGRALNLIAALDPQPAPVPHVLLPGRTRMAFIDHFYPAGIRAEELSATQDELGDFVCGWFEYKVNKTPAGVKAILARQGSIRQGEKSCPLGMEKVFGLDGDRPEMSFVYQMENRSMAGYAFTFATELTLALPGLAVGKGRLVCGKKVHDDFVWERLTFSDVTDLIFEDWLSGVRVRIRTQKPLSVFCHPLGNPSTGYQGTALILSSAVELAGGALWGLMGKISVRAIRKR